MKCIYCNTEESMSISDIIPWALTGAKVRKSFVCKKHNLYTNDHYESKFIKNLAFFRNELGLKERSGDLVRFQTDIDIDGHTFKNVYVTDRGSIVGKNKRIFSQKNDAGEKTLLGPTDKLLNIPGATLEKIDSVDLSKVTITGKYNISDLFASPEALHTVAKIAYEWHCYINNIEGYDNKIYSNIVSYLLETGDPSVPVKIVNEPILWRTFDDTSRTGSNILFEYNDIDGNTYVVFAFWNVLLYKICICSSLGNSFKDNDTLYFYHPDGTAETRQLFFAKDKHIQDIAVEAGITKYSDSIKNHLSALGQRDLSYPYLNSQICRIRNKLTLYIDNKCSIAELLNYEDTDTFYAVYILEFLYNNQNKYLHGISFNTNLKNILSSTDQLNINDAVKTAALQRYLQMDNDGDLGKMLTGAIAFWDTINP